MFKKINILYLFFEEPTREFNVREAARLVKCSPASASKELKNLHKQDLLKGRDERMLKLYRANLESDLYRDKKVYYNIRKLKDSGFIEALNQFYLWPAIIVYGSTSNGLDTENSDIDLVIISEKVEEFPDLKNFEKKFRKEIHIFNFKEVKDIKNDNLLNSMANGYIIQGMVEWI